jgi:hypothetical protein
MGQPAKPAERPRIALMLLRLLDPAERAPRREARLVGAHAACEELFLEELQVRVDFTCQLRLRPPAAEQGEEPEKEAPGRRHGVGSGFQQQRVDQPPEPSPALGLPGELPLAGGGTSRPGCSRSSATPP